MKKGFLLVLTILLSIMCLSMFVSCSDNIMDDSPTAKDDLVYATFDKGSSSRAVSSTYTQTVTLKEINEVYWTYTAKKADSAGHTGETTAETAVKSSFETGLDGVIGQFSQGLWNFEVFGYTKGTDATEHDADKVTVGTDKYYSGLIYSGKVEDVKLVLTSALGTEENPNPINVIINLLTEKGTGTFAISNLSDFIWKDDSGEACSNMYLTMLATKDSDTKSEAFALTYDETNDNYKFADTETTLSWTDYTAGSWTMVFAVVQSNDTEPTYADNAWSNVSYTYATSPELLVKIYTGQTTTLKANVIEGNFAYGKFNGSIVDGIKEATVTVNVDTTKDTVFESSVTVASISTDNKTTVTIPKEVKELTSDSKAALTITATPIVAANSMFTISDNTGAVGAIDLTATVTTTGADGAEETKEVTKFTSDGTTAVAVTVETYVAKNMSNVTVTYNGTGDAPTDVTYDATTGKLTFKTTHFSTFLVGADQNVYDESTNTAYTLSSDGKIKDKDGNEKDVSDLGSSLVLFDCALSNNVLDEWIKSNDNANGKTWEVVHHNCDNQTGYFWHKEYTAYFPSGYGTKLEPYIIEGTAELENTYYFTKGYAYYKVADAVESIDCTNLKAYYVRLSGSLDGNGVKFENNSSAMFYSVYSFYTLDTPIVLKNFEANFNLEGSLDIASGMIYVLGEDETTFKNITITGKIEGGSNSGVFYTYPMTMWYSMSDGYTQKVNLEDCTVEAELYAPNGTFGIIAGHPTAYMNYTNTSNGKTYSPNAKLVVTCDKTLNALFTGTAYTKPESDGKSYVQFFNLNNNLISFSSDSKSGITTSDKIECNSFYTCNPTFTENTGYSIEWVSGAVRMEVYISAQLTEADESGNNTANNGITLGLADWKTIKTSDSDYSSSGQNVLGVVDSIDVMLNSDDYDATYDDTNKKLTASVPWTGPNVYGSIKLQVVQYNSDDKMIGYGTKTIAEKSAYNGTWNLKK